MMKTIYFILTICLFTACTSKTNKEETPLKSEHLVAATNWFQNSAEMRACYYQAYYLAKLQLNINKIESNGDKPFAVVLDIDETVLDNSPFQASIILNNNEYNSELWKQWTDLGEAKPLPGALDFTTFAQLIGVEVFYISNRKLNELESTILNLNHYGFPNADTAHVLLRGKSRDKSERRSIVSANYNILLFVGDNLTDFDQLFEDRGSDLGFSLVDSNKDKFGKNFIMLPNPMYGNWEGSLYGGDNGLPSSEKQQLRYKALKGY